MQAENTQYQCTFEFAVQLSPKAAKSHAEVTSKLEVNSTFANYLSKPLDLYVDGRYMSSLQIASSLKGIEAPRISISGPGAGATEKEAIDNTIREMNSLQTILLTGSLPTTLKIIEIKSISPSLGESFFKNALLAGLAALVTVCIVIYIRYRRIKIIIPMLITLLSELFIIVGLASLFKQSIDVAAIAGIIAAVGTGVNDQIIITDEALKGEASRRNRSWKEKIKSAFSVIMGAYFTLLFAMLPLFVIGAGLLRGFAVTTIIGMTVGVFITRPAYAKIVEILVEK